MVCVLLGLALSLASAGCGDDGIQPGTLRYGQLGSIRVVLDAPLRLGEGRLRQTIEWKSNGAWTLQEAILYHGEIGDEDLRKSPNPAQHVADYAGLITQLNEVEGLQVYDFAPLDSIDYVPICAETRTTVTFTIRDDAKGEESTWVRCAEGSFATLTTANASPGSAASRIPQAALLVRDYTVGEKFASRYAGSVPFATLDRGDDLSATERASTIFTDSASFRSFWGQAAGGRPLPTVDFSNEMVILGVVGEREEAGDSVEVRRILQVDQGTLIEVWERVPGDYCSPIAQKHVPYHLVVAPLTPTPLRFSDIGVEFVPCGG